jgi:hypothetical protein
LTNWVNGQTYLARADNSWAVRGATNGDYAVWYLSGKYEITNITGQIYGGSATAITGTLSYTASKFGTSFSVIGTVSADSDGDTDLTLSQNIFTNGAMRWDITGYDGAWSDTNIVSFHAPVLRLSE